MKILLVTGIFPPDIGGPASYVPRIAQALMERGHDVAVITLADRPAIAKPNGYGFEVHRIERATPHFRRMWKTIALIRSLARSFDLIYANGLVLEAAIAARLSARPIVVKVVGDTIWERARNNGREESLDAFQTASLPLKWRFSRVLQDLYMRSVQRVITPSKYLKTIVCGWGLSSRKVLVVYNAVPIGPSPGCSVEPDVDLVSAGRLVPWKGFEQLVSIVAKNGWTLKIIGDGPLREPLEAHARETGAAVEFVGHVPQSEVANLIRRGRVFVLNSSYEGLPHIVLEAMAAEVPVVATAVGGTPETIVDGTTGLLVPFGDDKALQEGIARLLADPSLRDIIATNAKVRLADRFSFDRMAADTERALVDVVGAASRQREARGTAA
jgi:glycosyltransferase involved in cell wall biosynthesis